MKFLIALILSFTTLTSFAQTSEIIEVEEALKNESVETKLAAEEFLQEDMNVFDKKRLKKLKKKKGISGANEIYAEWIKSKNFGDTCSEHIGTCDYYLCREKNNSCGVTGYYLAFGYQYCQTSFTSLNSKVSPKGQKWLKDVATCLQEKVETEISPTHRCEEIKSASIASHESCYEQTNFCGQKFKDVLKVLGMLSPELTKPKMILLGIKIIKNCIL